jgi:hypothetical protein|tara:strand:- start:2316 stop:2459 length:144 start_codon:yes stop_codon:yes gene_type:complete
MSNYIYKYLPLPQWLPEENNNVIQTKKAEDTHIVIIDLYEKETTKRN